MESRWKAGGKLTKKTQSSVRMKKPGQTHTLKKIFMTLMMLSNDASGLTELLSLPPSLLRNTINRSSLKLSDLMISQHTAGCFIQYLPQSHYPSNSLLVVNGVASTDLLSSFLVSLFLYWHQVLSPAHLGAPSKKCQWLR